MMGISATKRGPLQVFLRSSCFGHCLAAVVYTHLIIFICKLSKLLKKKKSQFKIELYKVFINCLWQSFSMVIREIFVQNQ